MKGRLCAFFRKGFDRAEDDRSPAVLRHPWKTQRDVRHRTKGEQQTLAAFWAQGSDGRGRGRKLLSGQTAAIGVEAAV